MLDEKIHYWDMQQMVVGKPNVQIFSSTWLMFAYFWLAYPFVSFLIWLLFIQRLGLFVSFFLSLVNSMGSSHECFYSPKCSHLQETSTAVNLAAALTGEGISAFRFDFSGNG